nr:MAG TPA: hypothetical protein [Caudoviricetes sp.]
MEEKKRGRPAEKKLSADFYKKSAACPKDLALIAQGKIKLGAGMDTPVKPEYESRKEKPEYDSRKEKPEYDSRKEKPSITAKKEKPEYDSKKEKPKQDEAGGTPELTAQQAEALSKVCQTDELLDMMLRSLEQSGANQRWLDEAKISFSVGMMEVCRAILKPQGI